MRRGRTLRSSVTASLILLSYGYKPRTAASSRSNLSIHTFNR